MVTRGIVFYVCFSYGRDGEFVMIKDDFYEL